MSDQRIYQGLLAGAFFWCLAIVAVPFLHSEGHAVMEGVACFLGDCFARVCHRMPDRSFHLWGEPLGVCVRCTSIYGGFLLGMLVYPLWARGVRRAHPSRWWLVASAGPMAVDAALTILGIAQSTELARCATGALVGLLLPAYIVPLMSEAISEFSRSSASRRRPHMEDQPWMNGPTKCESPSLPGRSSERSREFPVST